MFDKNHLHIAIASDSNYAEFVATVITSLFATNSEFEKISIHLLSNNISCDIVDKIKRHIPNSKGDISVYDISDIQSRLSVSVPNTIAISSYARLFLSEIIPSSVDRILYVDCDVVFNNSVKSLWDIEMNGISVAGVLDTLPDSTSKLKIGLTENSPYINAGILLVNLAQWRKINIQKRFIDFLLSYEGKVHHHDQGIINAVCTDKIIVSPKYNLISTYLSHPYRLLKRTNEPFYDNETIEEAKQNPAIIHFTEGFFNRPWIKNTKHPLASIYQKYHSQTEWHSSPLRPDKRSLAVKTLSWSFLNMPYPIYSFISKVISTLHSILK